MLPTWPAFQRNPKPKRVAIIGFSASSIDQTPWFDPDVELWGLNQGYMLFDRRPDRWFEIHLEQFRDDVAVDDYFGDLKSLGCPIYMIKKETEYPTSVEYPLQAVQMGVPEIYRRYFTSTVAYMVALAIHEGFQTIELYGVDCATGSEYEHQKPCIEAWLSLAMGRGIKVVIPPQSSLFKSAFLYGYEPAKKFPRFLKASEEFLLNRIEAYKTKHNELLNHTNQCEGAINELRELLHFAEAKSRGAVFPTVEGHE